MQNAIDQAKHAALAMVGKPKTYSEVPWFWSDQYDLKLQIAGLARPSDRLVLRGDPASRKFAVFHLRDGAVAAVEAVNAAPEYLMGKKWVGEEGNRAADAGRHFHCHETDGVMPPPSMNKYKVTYIEDSGKAHTVEVAEGWSLMEGAVKHLVPGIDADCGGACSCAILPGLCRAGMAGQAAAQKRDGRDHAGLRAGCAPEQQAVLSAAHERGVGRDCSQLAEKPALKIPTLLARGIL